MGIALTSESGATLGCTSSAWDFYLWLGESYGWQRTGTLPPKGVEPGDWDRLYDSNDGQQVTKEDAAALAEALEKNLTDPARAVHQRDVIRRLDAEVRRMALELEGIDLPDESETEPLPSDADLETLIDFLRKGSFRID